MSPSVFFTWHTTDLLYATADSRESNCENSNA